MAGDQQDANAAQDGEGPGQAAGTGPAPVLSLRERLSGTFLKPPSMKSAQEPVLDRPMTDDEKRQWIRSLSPLERKWGNIFSGIAALITIYTIYRVIQNEPVFTKVGNHKEWVSTQGSYEILLIIQLALAAGMYLSVRFRKRPLLGFCALLTGLADATITLFFGLPFVGFFGWLIIRAWRVQRYGSPTAKGAAAGASAKREAKRSGGTATKSSQAASTAKAAEASKRYTPKSEKSKGSNRYAPKS